VFNCACAWAGTAAFMTMLRSDFARSHGHLASFCMVPVLFRIYRASVSVFVSDKAAEFRTFVCLCDVDGGTEICFPQFGGLVIVLASVDACFHVIVCDFYRISCDDSPGTLAS
jgi:hypothetical protein